MKKIFIFIIFFCAIQTTKVQALGFINCDSFCVISIVYDTSAPNYLYVTIANNDSNFINYPIVQLIDTLGDTIANQQKIFDYYGQAPHSTQIYHIPTVLNSFPSNWSGQIRLEDGLFHEACIINYPCAGTLTGTSEAKNNSGFNIYPNPANTIFTITTDESMVGGILVVSDVTGRKLLSVQLSTTTRELSTTGLAEGVYVVTLEKEKMSVTNRLRVQK